MKKQRLLVSIICVSMAVTQMPVMALAASGEDDMPVSYVEEHTDYTGDPAEELISADTDYECSIYTDETPDATVFEDNYTYDTIAEGNAEDISDEGSIQDTDPVSAEFADGFAGGSGTASDPYQIASYDQLCLIGEQTGTGLYYVLTEDIAANDNAPGETSPNVWLPVDPKGCHFDGAGHTISNLCIGTETVATESADGNSSDKTYSALFGAKGTAEEIKDVSVNNVYFKGNAQYEATLAIHVKDMSGCKISGTIVRSNDSVDPDSVSLSTYIYPYIGCLAYESTGTVDSCTYDAVLDAKLVTSIAGIVYKAVNVTNNTTTAGSRITLSAGIVRGEYWFVLPLWGSVSGIVNTVSVNTGQSAAVSGNINNATIDASQGKDTHTASGIAINAYSQSGSIDFSGNINNGVVKGSEAAGLSQSIGGNISDCVNNGDVTGQSSAAGIATYLYKGTINKCKNNGNVTVTEGGSGIKDGFYGASGLICEASGQSVIRNCVNTGKIVCANAAAGVVGQVVSTGLSVMDGCANLGEISGSEAAGLVFCAMASSSYDNGVLMDPGKIYIIRSYNAGDVTVNNTEGEHGWGTAGIAGYAEGLTVENCFNAGRVDTSILNSEENNNAAGITGRMRDSSVKNSINTGMINAGNGKSYGIASVEEEAGECTITGCYYQNGSAADGAAGTVDGNTSEDLTAVLLSADEARSEDSYDGWDFDSTWQTGKNSAYGYPELKDNAYGAEPDVPETEYDFETEINGGVYVVNQKFDISASDKLKKTYSDYRIEPAKSVSISKNGIVTVKKAPSDNKITITGLVKKDGKLEPDKTLKITAVKPVIPNKTVKLTMPYDELVNPYDSNAYVSTYSLITGPYPTTWESSKKSVADYDPDRKIFKAYSNGTTKISAVYGDPASKQCVRYSLTLKVNIPKINKSKATLPSGAPLGLKLTGISTGSNVVWSSSDPESVSVDPSTGKVTVLKYNEETAGKATISAAIDGKQFSRYSCDITVTKPVVSPQTKILKTGKSLKITVKKTKLKTNNGGITFRSSDENIATVDAKGKITAKSVGDCVITVNVGGYEVPVNIKVQ